MNAGERYFDELSRVLERVRSTQAGAIEAAAAACAQAIGNQGMIYAFGTGHSHLLAEEIFYRAGGLAAVCPILEEPLMLTHAARSSRMERLTGYAELLLEEAEPAKGSVMLLFSNSGRNSVAIEMAQEAVKRGLTTICITNMAHSAKSSSRHPSGKRLFELCDIVIDNCGCQGDACVELYGRKSGATSTAAGAAILQAIVCRTVELCGGKAEVFCSANVDGGEEANAAYVAKYKKLVKPL